METSFGLQIDAIEQLKRELAIIDAATNAAEANGKGNGIVRNGSFQLKNSDGTINWKEAFELVLAKEDCLMKSRELVKKIFPEETDEKVIGKLVVSAAGAE